MQQQQYNYQQQPAFLYRVKADFSVFDALLHVLAWVLVGIITFTIGFYFMPYGIANFIISNVYLVDSNGQRVARLECDLTFSERLGHILVWFIVSILTLGIGFIVYNYMVWRYAFENTRIVGA